MVGRSTRASKAREAATLASPQVTNPEPQQLSSPPTTPAPRARKARITKAAKGDAPRAGEDLFVKEQLTAPKTPKSTRKRKQAQVKEEDPHELPHNLGNGLPVSPAADVTDGPPAKKSRMKSRNSDSNAAIKAEDVDGLVAKSTSTPKSAKKEKNASYGLTPGQTPYPNWPHPTPEECQEVARLLSSVHGKVQAPKKVPMPSLKVAACGEVPSVLDALLRTRLSAATSGTNSSRAFAGLVKRFGVLKEGIGKGSVDWNAVRQADTKEIFEAIKSGGLADVKSKDIKAILQMVYEENQARREKLTSGGAAPGSNNEDAEEKNLEIARAEGNVISLDHLHLLSNDEAFNALTKYPGIGPKTASCVLLFCLQRPSFAVDTHVFRLCSWLGWVPPPGDPAGLAQGKKGTFTGATRNSTYAHLEVRIPDDLKYPLHQLFIKHGKNCPRCRAITGESSARWEEGCVIDHLVKRTGGRKGIAGSPEKGEKTISSTRGKRQTKRKPLVEEDEDSELSDPPSSDESSDFEG